MTTTNSQVTVFPEKLYDLRVLLVESDQNSLKHHAYMLSRNSYRVTSTRKASTGLSLIINGNIFDCVLVDAENLGMNMVHFLHQISKHQPHLPIIVMAWSDFQVRIVKDTLAIEPIWFLQKPCQVRQICNILQHVCSTKKSLEEKQGRNNVHRVNTVVMPSAIRNTISISNNISSRIGIHRGLNINSHKYGSMSKPVNYIDISSDDDELTIKENAYTGRAKNIDKGKKPMELKRKNDQRVEDGICRKNKIEIKTEIPWTTADNGKFMESSNALHKKNAYRKEIPILKQKKFLGFTYDHVTSHLQIFQERKNNIKKPNVVAPIQMGNNLQVASYACNRFGLSTPSDNDATITQCNNSTGTSYMTLDNIKAKLQQASPLPLSQQITTTLNYSSGNKGNGHNFSDLFQPSIGATEESLFNLVEDVNNSLNCSANGNYGGSGVSKTLAPFDSFGIKVEPLVTTTGSVATSSNQGRLEDLIFTEFPSSDLGGISPLQDFEKFEGNVENLFDEDSRNLSFSNSDSVTFGNAGDDYSFPSIQGEENNSIVPFDGSEGRVIDDDWFLGMIHPE